MKYEIEAADFVRLLLLASHLDTDDELVGILMRVSKADMDRQTSPATGAAAEKPVRPEE